jgi:putative membrane protein
MNTSRYNPLSLFISIIHVSSESVFRKLKYFLLFILIYATIIEFLNYKFNFVSENNELGQFHLLFSFCLSIVISFRINIAYARWWEARGIWGTLVNNSRHLAMKFNNYIGFENDQDMKNYIAKFPLLLKYHLYRDINSCSQVIKNLGISHTDEHLPNLLIQNIVNKIGYYRLNSQISFEQFLALDFLFILPLFLPFDGLS